MKMHNLTFHKTTPFGISLLGHLALFLSVLIYLHVSTPALKPGTTDAVIVPAYLAKNSSAQHSMVIAAKTNPLLVKPLLQPIIHQPLALLLPPKKLAPHKAISPVQTPLTHTPQLAGEGKPPSELVTLLHAAIEQQQHYPGSALDMQREGRTTLMFTLYANGSIDHLHIVKSSGTSSLDAAALTAVNDALPFRGVEHYIQQPHSYQVDVVFVLT